MLKSFSLIILAFSTLTFAETTFDKTDVLNGVTLKSGKEDSVRSFMANTDKLLPYPINLVKKGITNFSQRCNNSYKDKRKFTSEKENCKYHNENLVESFVIHDIRKMDYFKNLSEAYLVGRQVYNRGSFGYYELVTINESMNEKKQKTITIVLRMLDDKEVNLFTDPKFTRETAFDNSATTFTLTQIDANQTHLAYEYRAETDHWLLNKEVSVPQVFASIGRSVNNFMKTVETESSLQKRGLASKK